MIVPSSGEVIAEEIQVALEESIPREEQGDAIGAFVRVIADEVAAVTRMMWGWADGG